MAISSRSRLRLRSGATLGALAVTASVALAACGSSTSTPSATPHPAGTPAQQVHQALAALADGTSVQAVGSLQISDAVAKKIQSSGLTAAQVDALRKGTITMISAAPAGSTLAQTMGRSTQPAGAASSVSIATGSTPLADLMATGGKVYARVNLPEWSTLTGKNLAKDVDQLTTMMPTAGAAVHALQTDNWLSADLKGLTDMAKKGGGATPPSLSPDQSKQLGTKLLTDLERASKVTASADGSTYTVVVGLKKFVTDVEADVAPLLPSSTSLGTLPAPKIPADRTVTVQVGVKNGVADDLHLDLMQFMSKADQAGAALTGQTFAVDIALNQNVPAPQAPSGATSIDQLFRSLTSIAG